MNNPNSPRSILFQILPITPNICSVTIWKHGHPLCVQLFENICRHGQAAIIRAQGTISSFGSSVVTIPGLFMGLLWRELPPHRTTLTMSIWVVDDAITGTDSQYILSQWESFSTCSDWFIAGFHYILTLEQ